MEWLGDKRKLKEKVVKAIGSLRMQKQQEWMGYRQRCLPGTYGGDSVIEWMHKICQMAWEEEKVPGDWTEAVIIPIYKGKGDKNECGSYRGISLLSIPGKVYGKVVIEWVK